MSVNGALVSTAVRAMEPKRHVFLAEYEIILSKSRRVNTPVARESFKSQRAPALLRN